MIAHLILSLSAVKRVVVPLLVVVLLAAAAAVRFFTIPTVVIACAPYERVFLDRLVPRGILKGYRIAFSDDAQGADIATPSVNIEMGRGDVFTVGETALEQDRGAMWSLAYGSLDSTYISAVVYDSTSLEELAFEKEAPSWMARYGYESRISSVKAKSMAEKLSDELVQTLVVYNPNKAIELIRLDEGYTIITTDLYSVALETVKVASTVGPDYRALLEMALGKREVGTVVPYILLPCKQGLEVVLDHIL